MCLAGHVFVGCELLEFMFWGAGCFDVLNDSVRLEVKSW